MSRPIASVMGLSGVMLLMQGWLAGAEGFSPLHAAAIVAAEAMNAAWMISLLMVAWRGGTRAYNPAP